MKGEGTEILVTQLYLQKNLKTEEIEALRNNRQMILGYNRSHDFSLASSISLDLYNIICLLLRRASISSVLKFFSTYNCVTNISVPSPMPFHLMFFWSRIREGDQHYPLLRLCLHRLPRKDYHPSAAAFVVWLVWCGGYFA